jgi:hypothetical protein
VESRQSQIFLTHSHILLNSHLTPSLRLIPAPPTFLPSHSLNPFRTLLTHSLSSVILGPPTSNLLLDTLLTDHQMLIPISQPHPHLPSHTHPHLPSHPLLFIILPSNATWPSPQTAIVLYALHSDKARSLSSNYPNVFPSLSLSRRFKLTRLKKHC